MFKATSVPWIYVVYYWLKVDFMNSHSSVMFFVIEVYGVTSFILNRRFLILHLIAIQLLITIVLYENIINLNVYD